jgi:putative ABC transport system permease protein
MGKLINSDNQKDFMVTGVVEDVPNNSHFHFDFLQSLVGKQDADSPVWFFNDFYTYIVLQEDALVGNLEAKLYESVKKYIDPQIRGLLGISVDEWFASGGDYRYFLQPLTDIHLRSHMEFELEPNGNIVYIYLFATIALGILLIACFNFVNLSTAYSEIRAKEVGIRKTVGSNRNQLIGQFVFETILYAFVALVFALAIVQFILPAFNSLTAKELVLPFTEKTYFIPILIGFTFLLGTIAGFYPALFLASFHPVAVLKGVQSKAGRRPVMRSVLVVVQFVISISLIIGTLIIKNQLEYIQKKNLGFNKDQVVVIHKTDNLGNNIDTFKEELLKIPGIISASKSTNLMGYHFEYAALFPEGAKSEKNHIICYVDTDHDFLNTYQMELKEGRFFDQERQTDREAVILNEAAVKELGMENPVGKKLINGMFKQQYPIIGVVKDFHFESLNQKIKPMLIANLASQQTGRYISVRIRSDNIREDLVSMQNVWQQFSLNQPFEYEFFDRHFSRYFLSEDKTAQIFMVFSVLAIIIACLGLFGLAAFIADQKKKEIGVRKVLGASFSEIIILLYSKFTRWILLSAFISWPIAYILMHKWLQNFAYRTIISYHSFVFATTLTTAVAFMAISYQSVKAAFTNPVETIRDE